LGIICKVQLNLIIKAAKEKLNDVIGGEHMNNMDSKAGTLQAFIAGERIYKKLGYETMIYYRRYPIKL